jgi:pimeloyl-ACP methyl ester carboxylesterase
MVRSLIVPVRTSTRRSNEIFYLSCGKATRSLLGLLLLLFLTALNVAAQSNSPFSVDQVVTNTGNGGSPTAPSLTPSQPDELAFLFVNGDFTGGNDNPCHEMGTSDLVAMSPPWVAAGTGPYEDTNFYGNVYNSPFTNGSMPHFTGGIGWGDFPFWARTSGPISATGTAVWPACFSNDWSTVEVLIKAPPETVLAGRMQGTNLPVSEGWGLPVSGPSFLIGYMVWHDAGLLDGATISDQAGNTYQIIADVQTSSGCTPPLPQPPYYFLPYPNGCATYGTHITVFVCNNFVSPSGPLTIFPPYGPPNTGPFIVAFAAAFKPGVPPPSIIDPVPALLSGPTVTPDAQKLATLGRVVLGAAADGVTQLVVRVPTANVGDQVTLKLMNDQQAQSSSSDDDGGLGQIGDTNFTQSQINVTSEDTGGSGAYAFAIYRVPVDFARQNLGDGFLARRTVSINIQDQTQGGAINVLPITILRPPVVLVHGLWDDPSTWNNFAPLVTGPNSWDSRFSIWRVRYDQLIGPKIVNTIPAYSLELQNRIKANSMGFAYNAPRVLEQVAQSIGAFEAGKNPFGGPVAAVQADIVAHSMGGLITRTLALQPSFLGDDTFGMGNIHKLITIDTPHLGSQVATQLLAPQETGGCLQKLLAAGLPLVAKGNKFVLSFADFADGTDYDGAVADLEGDDTTNPPQLSTALRALNTSTSHLLPTAPIAGVYTNFGVLDSMVSPAFAIRNLLCSSDPFAQQLTSTGWPQVFHNNPTDAIVSENSQLYGGLAGSQFSGEVHSQGTEALGFSPPSVLDAGDIPNQVIFLLNKSWKNFVYYTNINP